MSYRELRLQTAINHLAKYFGINTIDDLINGALVSTERRRDLSAITTERDVAVAGALEINETFGHRPNSPQDIREITQIGNETFLGRELDALSRAVSIDSKQGTLIKNIIDTSNGAYLTSDLIRQLNNLLQGTTEDERRQFFSLFEIYYGNSGQTDGYYQLMDFLNNTLSNPPINRYKAIVGTTGQDGNGILQINDEDKINSNITESDRQTSPNIAVYVSKHPRISLNLRNANACTIFFNGMPSYELSRAVPYLEITMFYPRPSLSSDGRLFATSIAKFLDGAKQIDSQNQSNPEYVMAKANEMAGAEVSRFPQIETYSKAGMELFLSPQTLVNANTTDDVTLRANPVLDKFRPFLSVKSFNVEIRPSTGEMSTKTATLKLILHDRSRMNEIADLLKADLYSSQEIDIEYGWSHPDNNIVSNVPNDYADLINGMRVKERYGVMGSTFSFLDSGAGVEIELQLFTRGAVETMTQLIFNYSSETQNYMRTMREIQETIARLRNRIYPAPEENQRAREVRAPQILDAAVDANATFRFSSEQLRQLRQLRTSLGSNTRANSDLTQLSQQLNQIFGEVTQTTDSSSGTGIIRDLRQSIIQNAQTQLQSLRNLNGLRDPFYRPGQSNATAGGSSPNPGIRNVAQPTGRTARDERNALNEYHNQFNSSIAENSFCSFATLMLHMVGKPLAVTHRFDEIQFLYYPFNNKAGYANGLTTANFLIDLNHFEEQLIRNRLENANSSTAMTIREFIRFMQVNFFDDQSSYSYGLWGQNGTSLVREAIDRTTGTARVSPVADLPQYQNQLHEILRNVTPNGDFQLPQVEVLLECIPSKASRTEQEAVPEYEYGNKNILRIHVFDASATAFSSEAAILNAAREDQLGILNTILPSASPSAGNTTEVLDNTRAAYQQVLQAAIDFGIIEVRGNNGVVITDTNLARQAILENTGNIRILGGSRKVKEFLFKTAPHIIYGANGSTVINAQISSQPDTTLQTIQLQRSPSQSSLLPSGEQPGGLPMQVIPSQINLTTLGNPLVSYMQNFFLDLQTGTTLDNIYYVTGLSHTIEPGKFTTQMQFSANDAYQQYNNLNSRITNMISVVNQAASAQGTEAPGTVTSPTSPATPSGASTGTSSPQAPTG